MRSSTGSRQLRGHALSQRSSGRPLQAQWLSATCLQAGLVTATPPSPVRKRRLDGIDASAGVVKPAGPALTPGSGVDPLTPAAEPAGKLSFSLSGASAPQVSHAADSTFSCPLVWPSAYYASSRHGMLSARKARTSFTARLPAERRLPRKHVRRHRAAAALAQTGHGHAQAAQRRWCRRRCLRSCGRRWQPRSLEPEAFSAQTQVRAATLTHQLAGSMISAHALAQHDTAPQTATCNPACRHVLSCLVQCCRQSKPPTASHRARTMH